MELKEFVKDVMSQIGEATDELSEGTDYSHILDCSKSKGVHFDLLVQSTKSEGTGIKGGAKVSVLNFVKGGVEGKGSSSDEMTQANQIKFNIMTFSK